MKLVHIGIVVKNIDTYLINNVINESSEIVYDEIQDADITFIINQNSVIGIELIQPKSANSMVYNFLNKTGGGLHHLCYEVDSVEEVERIVNKNNMIIIFGPAKAIALDNHIVIFAYTRNKELIEFEVCNNAVE